MFLTYQTYFFGENSMNSLKILAFDDSILAIKKMESGLNSLGHKIIRQELTGKNAAQAYRECRPDLVTMDIVMPDVGGIDATIQIIEEFPDAVIIMVTSHGQEDIVREAINVGARGYVVKPFRVDELKRQIELALEND